MCTSSRSQPSNTDWVGYREVEHTADVALNIRGDSLSDLMVNAARGLNHLMVASIAHLSGSVKRRLELKALDAESLLVEWLGELAYLAESEGLIFVEFDIQTVSATRLTARLGGVTVAGLKRHIKAVTYHNLEIVTRDDGLEATVVFDV